MSLDVQLVVEGSKSPRAGSGIFVRKDGQTKEISQEEWESKFPGVKPVAFRDDSETDIVFDANITHNLGQMAEVAGLYRALWRPEDLGFVRARELVDPLVNGLSRLEEMPDHFRKFDPTNGWGTYETLVEFVRNYLRACTQYPDAKIDISR